MITERFIVLPYTKETRRTTRFIERFIFASCFVVCVIFLYNDRYIHDLLTKNERLYKMYRRREERHNDSSTHRQAGFLENLDQDESRSRTSNQPSHCRPRNNIVFLKTHRTGSSTITNILNRYGDSRNLTFVLPKKGKYRLRWPYLFNTAAYAPLQGRTPNILCNHARYNREELDRLMPKDVAHVTIIRDPADQFSSVFEKFKLGEILGINSTDSLSEFLSNPWFYLEKALENENIQAIEFHRLQLARNGIMFDLGFDPLDYDNTDRIRRYIERLDKEFSLVMLTEYFTESLVLLKYLMCWDFNDVLHFALNARTHSNQRTPLTEYLKSRIREWNEGDFLLYKHFNESFWTKVNTYGEGFFNDVTILGNKIKLWENTCRAMENRTKFDSKEIGNLESTLEMCRKLIKNETSYIEYFQNKQNI